jgi:hypothetical protein
VRVRLTPKGLAIHRLVAGLFRRHADSLAESERLRAEGLEGMNRDLRSLERYWAEQIRHLY